jgi:hypothetical protein
MLNEATVHNDQNHGYGLTGDQIPAFIVEISSRVTFQPRTLFSVSLRSPN